ncbi:MAG: RNA pseudouridine synthase, partial [Oscillospiraceae bacterium]|nr:RNA pseudouridine synthase [Oscillospiraceae bacterium]
MEEKSWIVPPEKAGERIDRHAADSLQVTRSVAQSWLDAGLVSANGRPVTKNYKLKGGDVLLVQVPPPVSYEARAQDIPLDVVYEDGDLLVVNKPKGMVVHPAPGNHDGTLVNALLAHCG